MQRMRLKLKSQFDDEKFRLRRKKKSGDTTSRIFRTDRGVLSVSLDDVETTHIETGKNQRKAADQRCTTTTLSSEMKRVGKRRRSWWADVARVSSWCHTLCPPRVQAKSGSQMKLSRISRRWAIMATWSFEVIKSQR